MLTRRTVRSGFWLVFWREIGWLRRRPFLLGLTTIVPLAQPTERAGVISVAYVICYLAMGLPAILAGVLVVHSTVTQTAQEFGAAVIVLAAITAAGLVLTGRRTRATRPLTTCTAAR